MFNPNDLEQLQNFIEVAENIGIVAHKSPDGDSVGSSMGLYFYLKKKFPEKNIQVCHPDPAPPFLSWAQPNQEILNFEENPDEVRDVIHQADLLFCLDFNDISRTGDAMQEVLVQHQGQKIMVDHHLEPKREQFDLTFSFPERSSTCELVLELILALDGSNILDEQIGSRLYLGMVTDTGSFRYSSVTPRTHELVAKLLEAGVENSKIHEQTFDDNTLDRIQLRSFILSSCLEILEIEKTAILYLTKADSNRYAMQKGDTEGLVNVALSIQGIDRAAFFREEEDYVRISFRSKSNAQVNELASKYFHGGGHKQAAGGRFDGSLSDAISLFKKVIHE